MPISAFAAACAAAFALSALPAHAAKRVIVIENMQFAPANVTVKAGDEVTWDNKDLVAHTATAKGAFDSHSIAPGGSWTYMARTPGRYAYGCSLHPTMKATLVVEKAKERKP
ncbi:cupredoxin domain-containing protein [Trinickia dinghuensis]|uniref:EfeO-type cupredoxin-like domain-containing protein n=1 Tax=Trinickia dinghuensis TaxID=2291023 RepID=A0A3D8JUT6_9BURK|nr:cupredoxin family copper-binding protein [Trinickia dinghuensis]RDU96849.1 hypothetical protein DWV00_21540 [Trinickia dinghuensis]